MQKGLFCIQVWNKQINNAPVDFDWSVLLISLSHNNLCGTQRYTTLLRIHRLAGGDGDEVVDIFHAAAAAEVVDRLGDALEDGANGFGVVEALDELVGDVADFQIGEYQNVGGTRDLGTGSLLLSD